MSTHEVEPIGAVDVIVEELVELLQPLELLQSPEEVTRLVRGLGFDFPDTTPFPTDF
ncbi:MAG: hypothetical protein QOE29_2198, partial [Gaiellaceae bacterium]|nr:hypothetical protein [Gaiellaceae bacterium]